MQIGPGASTEEFAWPLPSEEAGNLLVSFGDGGGSGCGCGAEFHDRNVALEIESEGGWGCVWLFGRQVQ